jgi:hypothetical protein
VLGSIGAPNARLRAVTSSGCGVAIAAALASCGGDDDASSEPATVEGVTSCLEDAGAKVEKIEVSLIDPPADLSAEFSAKEAATVWVTDSEDEAAGVVDNLDELNQIGNQPQDDQGPPIQVGNAVADPFGGPLSDETRGQIEACFG